MGNVAKSQQFARFSRVVLRAPNYMLLAANLARDKRLSRNQKVRALASLGYALSPLDLLPGLIPVVGQLDDLAVLIGGLRGVVRSCPAELAEEHLKRSGLELTTLDKDLATLRATGWWIARGTAGLFGGTVRRSASLLAGLVRSRQLRGFLAGRRP